MEIEITINSKQDLEVDIPNTLNTIAILNHLLITGNEPSSDFKAKASEFLRDYLLEVSLAIETFAKDNKWQFTHILNTIKKALTSF